MEDRGGNGTQEVGGGRLVGDGSKWGDTLMDFDIFSFVLPVSGDTVISSSEGCDPCAIALSVLPMRDSCLGILSNLEILDVEVECSLEGGARGRAAATALDKDWSSIQDSASQAVDTASTAAVMLTVSSDIEKTASQDPFASYRVPRYVSLYLRQELVRWCMLLNIADPLPGHLRRHRST